MVTRYAVLQWLVMHGYLNRSICKTERFSTGVARAWLWPRELKFGEAAGTAAGTAVLRTLGVYLSILTHHESRFCDSARYSVR